jgi:hypothetical protein
VSDEEDRELQALQRQLDDAFQTTRPRGGFEDELWARMQARRPWWQRVQAAFATLIGGVRRIPPAPAATVAVLLVLVISIGLLGSLGHRGGGASSTAGLSEGAQPGGAQTHFNPVAGGFGQLPSPVLGPGPGAADMNPPKEAGVRSPAASAAATPYFGPADLVWADELNVPISEVPVFRYMEPSAQDANRFATSVGAAAQSGQPGPGVLGSYSAPDFTLTVASSTQSPKREPSYILTPKAGSSAAGAAAADAAAAYLRSHGLMPTWQATVIVEQAGDIVRVRYLREFAVPGSGSAFLIDSLGERYGLEVDLSGSAVVQVVGPMPIAMDTALYRITSSGQAVQSALASGASGGGGITPTPTVRLTSAEIVYSLVWAGDHSFYEPAYLFSGTFTSNGVTYVKRVLVPAVDPSQRSS